MKGWFGMLFGVLSSSQAAERQTERDEEKYGDRVTAATPGNVELAHSRPEIAGDPWKMT